MQLEQSFEVTAPLDTVWEALIDVQRVAPCLPGAEVSGRNEDGSYDGTFKVKIGPTAAAYTGKLRMESIDEATHTATMDAQGTDRRGQGGAKATIVSSVTAIGPDSSRVDVSTDYHITGRLARFGRGGMIEEISNRLLNEFAKSLQEMLGGNAATAATVVRAVRKPGPAAAAAAKVEAAAAAAAEAELAAAAAVGPAPEPEAEAPSEAAAPVAEEPAVVPEEAAEVPAVPEEAAEVPAVPEEAAEVPAVPEEAAEVPAVPEGAVQVPAEPVTLAAASETAAPPPAAAAPAPPPPPPAPARESEPIQGLSLVGSVLWSRVKSNPAPVAAAVIGLLVVRRALRRRG